MYKTVVNRMFNMFIYSSFIHSLCALLEIHLLCVTSTALVAVFNMLILIFNDYKWFLSRKANPPKAPYFTNTWAIRV
jgi:hypothetical protein